MYGDPRGPVRGWFRWKTRSVLLDWSDGLCFFGGSWCWHFPCFQLDDSLLALFHESFHFCISHK
jgi:hypothetical protein